MALPVATAFFFSPIADINRGEHGLDTLRSDRYAKRTERPMVFGQQNARREQICERCSGKVVAVKIANINRALVDLAEYLGHVDDSEIRKPVLGEEPLQLRGRYTELPREDRQLAAGLVKRCEPHEQANRSVVRRAHRGRRTVGQATPAARPLCDILNFSRRLCGRPSRTCLYRERSSPRAGSSSVHR
jgi:hypothetical protein